MIKVLLGLTMFAFVGVSVLQASTTTIEDCANYLSEVNGTDKKCSSEKPVKSAEIPKNAVKCRSYATGYYPFNSRLEGGFKNRFGGKLYTLQAYLAGKAPYVTVAMDTPYSDGLAHKNGRKVRIPALDKAYNNGKPIDFRVMDTGSAFFWKSANKIDICMKNEKETLSPKINKKLDIYFVDGGTSCKV